MSNEALGPLHARNVVLVCRDRLAEERMIAGDSPLTIRSSSRASYDRLREWLPAPERCRLLVSPTRRAQQTAVRLFPEQTFEEDARLRPREMGRWVGMTWEQVREQDPRRCEAFWSEPAHTSAPGGERLDQLMERVRELISALTAGNEHGDTVAVTHPNVIRMAICVVLDLPAERIRSLSVDPLGVTRLTHSLLGWQLHAHNLSP